MDGHAGITNHYSRGDLLARLDAALTEDGIDPAHPNLEALAPYDQFHGRGLEATEEIAAMLSVSPGEHLLDVGSGIGGPARYFASRFGCRVTGIDLTAEFCAVARLLTRRLGLESRVDFEVGDALAMPFEDASFDGAYSMNVSMNIADKAALYAEIHRVLEPGGWLMLSEIAAGPSPAPGEALHYPLPWAAGADTSFLATPQETRRGLEAAGFEIVQMRDTIVQMRDTIAQMRDTIAQARDYGARSRAMVERGGKPPHRAVQLIHAAIAQQAMRNSSRGMLQGHLIPVEILSRRKP